MSWLDEYKRLTNRATGMRLYYRFLRFCAHWVLVLYFRGRVFGLRNVPNSGPVVLACNHQCFFDPVAVTMALHREGNYMARDTLFRNPLFKRLIESLNAFPVKRGAADVTAVKEMLRRLNDGKVVVVFPEATRTRDGSISPINANAMAVAKKAGAAIVPTVIDGAFEAWPRDQLLPAPRRMYISYQPVITREEVRAWPVERIAEVVSERLHAGLERSRFMRRRAARINEDHESASR